MDNNPTDGSPAEMHPEPHHEKDTVMAVVAYIIFFIPLLTDAKKDPFVKYHVHQGLVFFLALILVSIVVHMVMYVPIVGFLVGLILNVGLLALFVLGILNAVQGKETPLPLIGQFVSYFKF